MIGQPDINPLKSPVKFKLLNRDGGVSEITTDPESVTPVTAPIPRCDKREGEPRI
jgi:hypothetical protein